MIIVGINTRAGTKQLEKKCFVNNNDGMNGGEVLISLASVQEYLASRYSPVDA